MAEVDAAACTLSQVDPSVLRVPGELVEKALHESAVLARGFVLPGFPSLARSLGPLRVTEPSSVVTIPTSFSRWRGVPGGGKRVISQKP